MMNVLALGLVLSSLAAASVWSPQPDKHTAVPEDHRARHPPGDVVREGHRLIVVEYEREAPQQLPSQLPHPPQLQPSDHRRPVNDEAKEKLKDAPARREGGEEAKEELNAAAHGAKEKICDAYGVCKEKISGVFGKSKEKAAQLEETAKEDAARAADMAKEVKQKVAGNVSEVAERASDKAKGAAEKAREMERGAVEKAREMGKSAAEKAKEMERSVVEKAKETERNAAEKAREMKRNASEKAMEAKKNLTDILRRAREVAYDAATYVSAKEAADALAAVVHLMSFATAYGTCVWVTFVSSHILARALPRQQFGVLQSKLYPVYFRTMAYAVAAALLSHAFGPAGRRRIAPERGQGYVLLASLVLVLVNMLFLEPKATKVMFERMKMEKEEGRGRDMADVGVEATTRPASATSGLARTAPDHDASSAEQEATKSRMAELNRRLKRLNDYSSLLNVVTLMGLTWHLVHLSRVLQASC